MTYSAASALSPTEVGIGHLRFCPGRQFWTFWYDGRPVSSRHFWARFFMAHLLLRPRSRVHTIDPAALEDDRGGGDKSCYLQFNWIGSLAGARVGKKIVSRTEKGLRRDLEEADRGLGNYSSEPKTGIPSCYAPPRAQQSPYLKH
jgi:hypothetical protein